MAATSGAKSSAPRIRVDPPPGVLHAGCAALLCLTVAQAAGAQIIGLAEVVDADTIRINDTELDLFGIDAVERDQLCTHRGTPWTCGLRAARLLEDFVAENPVTCRIVDEDPHGRRYALCRVHNLDLGAEVTSQGYALHYPAGSRTYWRQLREARQRGNGIWDSIYVKPEEWRMWKR
jgi:endonuclease YncB( thermonuclease family)